MSFSKNDLELIKSKFLLSQEIEKKTKVIKKGKDSWCCCPFHDEKTPSCKINDDLGSFYCFGCGAKGDIFLTMGAGNIWRYAEELGKHYND